MNSLPDYQDHIGLWGGELKAWLPDKIFDAHVHLGPPEIASVISPARAQPLTTWTSLKWEEALAGYARLFSGKTMEGVIAFPFPIQEVNVAKANEYIADLLARDKRVKGFMVVNPAGIDEAKKQFYVYERKNARFYGIKPYYDLLGKSNYATGIEELLPRELLQFANSEKLMLMLHTSGIGVGDPAVRGYLRMAAENYPQIKIILAHMGRYLHPNQFLEFMDTDVMSYPSVYLEMSSGSSVAVYEKLLPHRELWPKLLFGSDLPWAMMAGLEFWDDKTAPGMFLTRTAYQWSDLNLLKKHTATCRQLTFNTYHVLKCFKDAVERAGLAPEEKHILKENVFFRNAGRLFAG